MRYPTDRELTAALKACDEIKTDITALHLLRRNVPMDVRAQRRCRQRLQDMQVSIFRLHVINRDLREPVLETNEVPEIEPPTKERR